MEIVGRFNAHSFLHIYSRQVGGHLGQTIKVAIEIVNYKHKTIKSIFYNKAQNSHLITGSHLEQFKAYWKSKCYQ